MDGAFADALVRSRRFFTKGTVSADLRTLSKVGGPRGRRLLPGPVEPRQGGPLDPWGELHGLVLVEGLRQGRDHHLGDPADRLPVGRAGLPGVRAPRLPARRGLLLVHLLADAGPLPLRPRRPAADVPRGQGAARRRPGQGVGAHRREPAAGQGLQVRARQGWPGPRHLGRGHRDRRRRARPHDQEVRPRPGGRLLADPGHVDGLARLRRQVREPDRRLDAELLRLVRRPAGGLAAGLRRPDRRPRVRRLVERRLPDHVGLQPPGHPHPRRALDDRGPLPRPEGDRGRPRLRRQREVRRRVAAGQAGHRRRAGDGDGPRRAQGVLRRPADAVLHPVRQDLHRPALPGAARRGGGRRVHRRQVPHRRRPASITRERRTPPSRPSSSTPAPASRSVPNGSLGHRYGEAGVGRWNLELGDVDPQLSLLDGARGDRAGADAALRHPRRRRRRPAARRPGPPDRRTPRHHGVRPAARAVRRRPRRVAGGVAAGVRRRRLAVHPGLAGDDHRRPGLDRGPDRPRVRRERRGVPRPVDDRDGRRHQPLVPLRHDLPRVPHPDQPHRLPGRQRRRLGALRRAGEGPADHRLHPDRQRAGLEPAAAQHDPDGVLVPPHQPVPLRPVRRRHAVRHHRQGPARREVHGRRDRPERPDGLDAVVPDLRPQPAHDQRRRRRGRQAGGRVRRRAAQVRRARLRRRGPRRAPELPARSCRSGGPTCSAPRARATSTSSSTCSAPTRRSARPRRRKASARST